MDEAASRIAAEQRSLRTAQHLDACGVEQLTRNAVDGAHIGIVHVNGDWCFKVVRKVVLRDATKIENRDIR